MSKSKEMAKVFCNRLNNGEPEKVVFIYAANELFNFIKETAKIRRAQSNEAIVSIIDEANLIWKSFVREVNKIRGEAYLSQGGFLALLENEFPEVYIVYQNFKG